MSRRTQELQGRYINQNVSLEEAQAQAQAHDCHTLQAAKDLLCTLWKQGRVTSGVWFDGDALLSAALHAVENPDLKNISPTQGATLALQQWDRQQRRSNEPF